jgi:hypothetical protein
MNNTNNIDPLIFSMKNLNHETTMHITHHFAKLFL